MCIAWMENERQLFCTHEWSLGPVTTVSVFKPLWWCLSCCVYSMVARVIPMKSCTIFMFAFTSCKRFLFSPFFSTRFRSLSLSLQNISFCSHYFNVFLKLANKHKRIHINAFERDKRLAVLSPFLSGGKPTCLHKNSDLLWSVFAWMDCISKLLRSVSKHPLLEKPILQNSLNPIRTHSQHKN